MSWTDPGGLSPDRGIPGPTRATLRNTEQRMARVPLNSVLFSDVPNRPRPHISTVCRTTRLIISIISSQHHRRITQRTYRCSSHAILDTLNIVWSTSLISKYYAYVRSLSLYVVFKLVTVVSKRVCVQALINKYLTYLAAIKTLQGFTSP